jgi:hypothetical protein
MDCGIFWSCLWHEGFRVFGIAIWSYGCRRHVAVNSFHQCLCCASVLVAQVCEEHKTWTRPHLPRGWVYTTGAIYFTASSVFLAPFLTPCATRLTPDLVPWAVLSAAFSVP